MIRLIYNVLWPLGLVLFLPSFLRKMFRRGGYREGFGARLGFYPANFGRENQALPPTWIHSVSVGETAIALKLIDELRRRRPDLRGVLTVTTTTAHSMALRLAPPQVRVVYSPLDFFPVMRRAFRAIQPERIILIEAEVWPNLVAEATQRGVPVILANARLSTRSERRFRRAKWFIAPVFQKLTAICVTTPEEAPRWQALGVPAANIFETGSIKFDTGEVRPRASPISEVFRRIVPTATAPVFFAGSTHPGEEEILARVFLALRQKFPDLFLVLAPRHVERTDEVEAVLRQAQLRSVRRSRLGATAVADCLLIDTTGELSDWYTVATIVFIGKSLTARGGQNPVEAIVAGKPVLFGSHMENFALLATQLVHAGGGVQVKDESELSREAERLLKDPISRERLSKSAMAVIAGHRGATARTADIIESVSHPKTGS